MLKNSQLFSATACTPLGHEGYFIVDHSVGLLYMANVYPVIVLYSQNSLKLWR